MEHEHGETNDDLASRLARVEAKVDGLYDLLNKANGAWFFTKLVGGFMMAAAVFWSTVHGWFGDGK